MKKLFKCGHRRLISNMTKQRGCRTCHNEQSQQYRKENHEKVLEMRRTYFKVNHVDIIKVQQKYRQENRLKIRMMKREYHKNNPEVYRRAARIRVYGANGVIHFETQKKNQNGLCAICRCKMKAPQQDHKHNCRTCLPNSVEKRKFCGKCLRGVLCIGCNFKLAWIESPWLHKAQKYLLKWNKL